MPSGSKPGAAAPNRTNDPVERRTRIGPIGAHTFGLVWTGDVVSAIERLADRGFSAFQLMAIPPHLDPWQPGADCIDRIRRAVSNANGRVVALDLPSTDSNLASPCREVRRFAIESYASLIRIAADCGAPRVTVQTGRRHKLLTPPGNLIVDLMRESLTELGEAADRANVRMLLENIPGTVLETGREMAGFLASHDFPNVDVLYDVANAFAAGEDPVAGMAAAASRIAVVHLSDCSAGQWQHAPIGAGDIDFDAVRRAMDGLTAVEEVVLEVVSADALDDMDSSRARLAGLGWAA